MADVSILNGYTIKDAKAQKLIYSNILNNPLGSMGGKLLSYYKEYASTTLPSGNELFKSLQGGVYIDQDDTIVLAYTNSPDFTQAILVTFDTSFNIISRSAPLNVGHCGSMAYNPNEQCIYCTSGDTGVNARKIVKVNKNTMTITSVINSPTDRTPKIISYDKDNNCYYIEDDLHIIKCDVDFNIIYSSVIDPKYNGEGTLTHQSGFVYNGVFYILYVSTINGGYNSLYFITYNEDGSVLNSITIPAPSTSLEAENVIVVNDVAYVCFGQSWLSVYKMNLTNESVNDSKPFDLQGTSILSSGDLNNVGIGYYFIPTAAAAQSVDNTPINNMGMLVNSYHAGNIIFQEVLTNEMIHYIRRCSGGTWGDWHNVSGRTIKFTPTYESNVGHTDVQMFLHGEMLTINGRFTLTSGFSANTWNTIATLPYAPVAQVQGCAASMTPTPTPIGVRITTDGLLQIYPPITQTTDARISMTVNLGTL